jgi:hypothetical protein
MNKPAHRFIQDFKSISEIFLKNGKSKFAHLINNGHSTAPTKNIMEILHVTKKGNKMKTLEKCHI